jgi:eukaryotic-like serine/threonine-protein kinase
LTGQSVAELIALGPLSPERVRDLGGDVARALEALWTRRIVHRDVKPDNLLRRDAEGSYVLLDPGYALDLADGSLTRAGAIVGTAPYYSPEQLDVNNRRALDCRSDLYSLGVVLYEAVTGVHPYFRPGMTYPELFAAIRGTSPEDPQVAGCPAGLALIISRLIHKRPHLRYRSPADLLTDLEQQETQR